VTIDKDPTADGPQTILPHESERRFIADGGLETTLVFHDGIDLPDFAAFPLLDDEDGRAALTRYYRGFQDIAASHGVGLLLDTPTWRASPDWASRLGWSEEPLITINRTAVHFVRDLAGERPHTQSVINGVIGPRGDGYAVGDAMSADDAERYHLLQAEAFAAAGADMITAVTMTYTDEAIGIIQAARQVNLPVAIGFTVETDGRLPSGERLRDATERVDAATGEAPVYFMINCAHPTHFAEQFDDDGPWLERIKAVRANASRLSHAELDEAEELDRGKPAELASDYLKIDEVLPDLRLIGGCCGTDHEHLDALAAVAARTTDAPS